MSRPKSRQRFFGLIGGLLAFLHSACATHAVSASSADKAGENRPDTKAAKSKPAKLKISGYGLLGDLQLKRMIRLLVLSGKKPEFFDANFVEDAALVVASTLKSDGYLKPMISAQMTLEDGRQLRFQWEEQPQSSLPRDLRIHKVHFQIHKGVVYHYKKLEIEGLKAIPEKQARSFFIETGLLLHLKAFRVYTPGKLRRGLSSLTEVLERQGFENATASVAQLERDDKTGAVSARIHVEEGRKSIVRSVREEFFSEEQTQPQEVKTVFPDKPYSKLWEQDFTQSLKTNRFHRGFPDARVEVKTLKREEVGALVQLELAMSIYSGPQIKLGDVQFKGEKKTKESMLRRRVRLQPGSLLDRIKVEEGRYRLVQLGIFDSVDLSYDTVAPDTRSVTYDLKESKSTDVNLLFGYGSYELLRGGVELERRNILGRAHHVRLKLVQSFKASSGELVYTIPEFVGRDVDLFVNGSGLRRQEISFLREEYGGGFGAHKFFKDLATDLSVRYNYQILNALQVDGFVATEGVRNPAVGAIQTDLKHDRRDNPLYPHRGYKVFTSFETASQYFAGDVNYERLEISTSWHQPLGGGRWLHLGATHGAAVPLGTSSNNLPFTKRFFPGGDTSIRGYQQDEASPKDATGRIVGAETFTLGSVQFEQALTAKWSLVLFCDALGQARRIQQYPFDRGLYSAGGGFNWRTIIGPVRLEYGHNLNPRPGDPRGTLHFSLGFPF